MFKNLDTGRDLIINAIAKGRTIEQYEMEEEEVEPHFLIPIDFPESLVSSSQFQFFESSDTNDNSDAAKKEEISSQRSNEIQKLLSYSKESMEEKGIKLVRVLKKPLTPHVNTPYDSSSETPSASETPSSNSILL